MSDNLTYDIQVDIINLLPVKSLVRFRSVSNAWKSLIDDPRFIAHYRGQQHLLVRYYDPLDYEKKCVSVVDDDTSFQHKVSVTIPLLVKMLKYSSIIGGSHGLLCLYGDHREARGNYVFESNYVSGTGKAVIWNPSIRKAVAVVVPNVGDGIYYESVIGFGVCRETMDPKIVKVTHIKRWMDMKSVSCIPWQVEVFTLSTGDWRNPYKNLPRKSIQFDYYQVVIDGVLYWLATDRITIDGKFMSYNLIISCDLTSEEFKEVNLPYSLAHKKFFYESCMSKLKESLVVLERDVEANFPVFYVWMMQDGASKLFTKLFTINVNIPHASVVYVRGFRKTGEPIVENHRGVTIALAVYEPYSKHINNLEIIAEHNSIFVSSYMETLLLFDQPDFMVYAKGKRCISKPRAKRRRLLKRKREPPQARKLLPRSPFLHRLHKQHVKIDLDLDFHDLYTKRRSEQLNRTSST